MFLGPVLMVGFQPALPWSCLWALLPFQSSLKLFLPQEKELLDNDDFELEKHGSSCLSEVERFYSLKTPIIIVKKRKYCTGKVQKAMEIHGISWNLSVIRNQSCHLVQMNTSCFSSNWWPVNGATLPRCHTRNLSLRVKPLRSPMTFTTLLFHNMLMALLQKKWLNTECPIEQCWIYNWEVGRTLFHHKLAVTRSSLPCFRQRSE